MRILLFEHDQVYGAKLRANLHRAGYTVDWLPQGTALSDVSHYEHFGALIFGHDLSNSRRRRGRMRGMSVKRVRENGHQIPILVLSGHDDIGEEIHLLDAGADDYLVKPVHPEVIHARLRAIMRRKAGRPDNAPITYGHIRLDLNKREVRYKDKPVSLNRKEYLLLVKLLENNGRVQPRENLEELLYGWDSEKESNTLEVYIYRLRKKFFSSFIQTVRGVGYVIREAA
ncbi:MAG: winged helix-turn-helix domain-containing protein [Nitrospiria bacterium]